jgi:hypothetical protein
MILFNPELHKTPYLLRDVEPLLGNDREITKYNTTFDYKANLAVAA